MGSHFSGVEDRDRYGSGEDAGREGRAQRSAGRWGRREKWENKRKREKLLGDLVGRLGLIAAIDGWATGGVVDSRVTEGVVGAMPSCCILTFAILVDMSDIADRIAAVKQEAEELKERIKQKKESLADTTRT